MAGPLGRGYGAIYVRGGGRRHVPNRLAAGRVAHLEPAAVGRGHPLAVNKKVFSQQALIAQLGHVPRYQWDVGLS